VNLLLASTYIFIIEIRKIQLAKQPGTSQEKFRTLKVFLWFSLFQIFCYCLVMTWAQYIAQDQLYYTDNKILVITLVCSVKSVKFLVDIVIIIFFARFIQFFLNLRKLELRRTTKLNKFILSIVILIFVISIYQSIFIFGLSIFYVVPELSTDENYLIQMINTNIFYVKDFFISLMLSYLFYFKGMQ
jgi:hypothetical protein